MKGFTLVELLVTAAVISILSVVTTALLSDTVTTRAAHYATIGSSQEIRRLLNEISRSVQASTSLSVPDSATLEIQGSPCLSVRQNPATQKIEIAQDASPECSPPDSGFTQLSSDRITITSFVVGPVSAQTDFINIRIGGSYQDGAGQHSFSYATTVHSRISL